MSDPNTELQAPVQIQVKLKICWLIQDGRRNALGYRLAKGKKFHFLFLVLYTEKNHILHVGPILFVYYQKLRKQCKCEICKDTEYNAVSGWYCTFNQGTVKVKESRNRPGVAQRVPGGLGSQISWHSARKGGEDVSLTHRPPLPTGMFLLLIFTRGWVDPRTTEWSEGDMSLRNPVTPLGIDPGTVQLVAQRLNHYATPGPI